MTKEVLMSLEKILAGVGKVGDAGIKAITSGTIRKSLAGTLRGMAQMVEPKAVPQKKEPAKAVKSAPAKKKRLKRKSLRIK